MCMQMTLIQAIASTDVTINYTIKSALFKHKWRRVGETWASF